MKYTIILLLSISLVLGCKREENQFLKNFQGTSELLFNDTKTNRFRVGAGFLGDDKADISFLYAINNLYNRENFVISVANLNITTLQRIYPLDRGDVSLPFNPKQSMSSFGTLSDDGDVLCHIYDVLEKDSLNNWVKITKYDKKTRELEGEFSVTYIKTRECTALAYPDTIRIRNGRFQTKIRD